MFLKYKKDNGNTGKKISVEFGAGIKLSIWVYLNLTWQSLFSQAITSFKGEALAAIRLCHQNGASPPPKPLKHPPPPQCLSGEPP